MTPSPKCSSKPSRAVHAASCVTGSWTSSRSDCWKGNQIQRMSHSYDMGTYRNEDIVFLDARVLKPFRNAAEASACGLPDRWILVLETTENEGPQLIHVWAHELGTSFHDNTQCQEGGTPLVWIGLIVEILMNNLRQSREDLGGWKRCGKRVDCAHGQLFMLSYELCLKIGGLTLEGVSSSSSSPSASVMIGIRDSSRGLPSPRAWILFFLLQGPRVRKGSPIVFENVLFDCHNESVQGH